MKLNHLDLQVTDVPATVALFERVFGLRCTSNPTSPAIAFLTDDDGFVLVLQRKRPDDAYPDGFHLGFLVDDVAIVHDVHARAAAEPALQVGAVTSNARGVMFYARAADGFLVEVSRRRG